MASSFWETKEKTQEKALWSSGRDWREAAWAHRTANRCQRLEGLRGHSRLEPSQWAQPDHTFWCLVAQSCPALCDPMDCSPPGSSVHEDSPGKNTGVSCHALLQRIFPTQGSNPGLSHFKWILYRLSHQSFGWRDSSVRKKKRTFAVFKQFFLPKKMSTFIWKDIARQYSWQHYLQWPRYGSKLYVQWQMNG